MKRALLDEIPEGKVSLENECIPRWMQEGRRLGGIVNGGYFIDIGVPESTLVMLVSALAGREHVLNAYEIAVQEKYRFFSFGDAMLITDTTV